MESGIKFQVFLGKISKHYITVFDAQALLKKSKDGITSSS